MKKKLWIHRYLDESLKDFLRDFWKGSKGVIGKLQISIFLLEKKIGRNLFEEISEKKHTSRNFWNSTSKVFQRNPLEKNLKDFLEKILTKDTLMKFFKKEIPVYSSKVTHVAFRKKNSGVISKGVSERIPREFLKKCLQDFVKLSLQEFIKENLEDFLMDLKKKVLWEFYN